MFLPVPGSTIALPVASSEPFEFSSDARARTAVQLDGLDNEVELDLVADQLEYLTGVVDCAVGWSVSHRDGSLLAPVATQVNTPATQLHSVQKLARLAALGCAGLADRNHQRQWMSQAGLDPNDPDNAALVKALQSPASALEGLQGGNAHFFRLDHQLKDAALPEKGEIPGEQGAEAGTLDNDPIIELTSARWQMLALRGDNEPLLQNKVVPLTDVEVPKDVLQEVKAVREHGLAFAGADDLSVLDLGEFALQ